jgi:hypothetical protein
MGRGHIEIVQRKSKSANGKIAITSGMRAILEDQMEMVRNSQFFDKYSG